MKKLFAFLILTFTPVSLIASFQDLPEAIKKADDCTVLIKLDDAKQTPIASGITVIRGEDYYVWTNAHVAEVVRYKDKESYKFKQLRVHKKIIKEGEEVSSLEVMAEVVVYDETIDIALLKLKDGDNKYFKNANFYLEDKLLPRGTDVLVLGNFLDFPGTTPGFTGTAPGHIGGYKHIMKDNGQELDIIHDGAVVGGCSGSGVWLEDGRCIGIVSRRYSTNEVLYNPIRVIVKWAKDNNLLWALDENVKKPLDK